MFHFMKSSHTTDSAQQILLVLFQLAWLFIWLNSTPSLQRLWLHIYYNLSLLSHITSNHGLQNELTFIPSFLVENHISTRSSTLANMVRTSYPLPGGIGSFAEFWPLECFETQRFCDGFTCFLLSPLLGEDAPFWPIFLRLNQTTYLKVTNVQWLSYSWMMGRCPAHSQIHSDTNLDLWLLTLTRGPIIMCL